MLRTRFRFFRLLAIPALVAGVCLSAASVRAEQIFGLTAVNTLISFDSATPGVLTNNAPITGIAANETIFDIDIRPANMVLYGFTNLGNIYTINTTTGFATLASTVNVGGVAIALPASRYGIDFNPVPDRLRIVSSTGQNLRTDVSNGSTTVDGNLNGADTRAVSVAYTNNDNNPATGTALFYIDSDGTDTTYTTANPNGGTLSAVGPLGVATDDNVGFDISGFSGVAYASLTSPTGVGSSLYRINLVSGAATLIGSIGSGQMTVRGIAAPAVPDAASTMLLLSLACGGLLLVHRGMSARRA